MTRAAILRWLQSIRGRLLICLLLVALVPAGLLAVVQTWVASRSLARTATLNLRSIADSKAEQIESYSRERLAIAAALTRAQGFVDAARKLREVVGANGVNSPEHREAMKPFRDPLGRLADALGYKDMLLIALNGDVLLGLTENLDTGPNLRTGPMRTSSLAALFGRVKMLLNPEFSRFDYDERQGQPVGFQGTPLFDEQNRLIAILVLQVDNRHVFRIFENYTGLGRTGEAVAGTLTRDGRSAMVLSRRRSSSSLPAGQSVPIGGDDGVALQLAATARRGSGISHNQKGDKILADWSYVPSFQWGLVVQQELDEAFALARRQQRIAWWLLGLTLLAATLVAPIVARSLARPIGLAADVAGRIARGDLTARVDKGYSGEPGMLLDALGTMSENLRALLSRIHRSSHEVLDATARIVSATERQKRIIQEYGTATTQTAAAVNEISGTSRSLLQTMDDLNHLAHRTSTMAQEGQSGLGGMTRKMEDLASGTTEIQGRLREIRDSADSINEVIATVTKLADRTNLLSLNANIEAEKAGEIARGFIVVAREVRRLSDQTAEATLDIEKNVLQMQKTADSGVHEMDGYSRQVNNVVADTNGIADRLRSIIDAVCVLTPQFEQVTEGMRAQSTGADQIREAMSTLREAAEESSQSIIDFEQASSQLEHSVHSLTDDVRRFELEA